jgi:integrase
MGATYRQKIKGNGNPWFIFVNHGGKRISKKIGSRSEAKQVADKINAKIALNDFSIKEEKPVPTFKEYADSWIKTTVPATCKESSIKDYGDILRIHVLPEFGGLDVTRITRGQIKEFLFRKINEGKAKSTVNHYRAVISGVLNQAVDDGAIPANPAHRLGRIGKKEDGNNEIYPLTREEVITLLDTIQADKDLSSQYPLFLLLLRTGARIGEALALQWPDIDFNGRFINIERTFSRGRIGTPKNGKSRTVDMSRQLKDALLELKESRKVIPIDEDSDWIFTNERGNLIDGNNWRRRVFNKVLKKAGLKRIRIHDTRHTYATLRLSKGDNIVDVANQLGDDVTVVLKVYSHWMPGKKKAEVDALDDPEYQSNIEKQINEG